MCVIFCECLCKYVLFSVSVFVNVCGLLLSVFVSVCYFLCAFANCVCLCGFVCVCDYVCVYVNVLLCVFVSVSVCSGIHFCLYVFLGVWCVYVCVGKCVYVYMCGNSYIQCRHRFQKIFISIDNIHVSSILGIYTTMSLVLM